jgi:hypothetical protein
LVLQRLSPKHRVAEALKHPGLLAGPLHDVAQTTYIKWVLNARGLTTQELRLLTFIHCLAWRTTSRCRATVAGSTKSSASNYTPP